MKKFFKKSSSLILLYMFLLFISTNTIYASDISENDLKTTNSDTEIFEEVITYDPNDPLSLNCAGAVLIDKKTGIVVYNKYMNEKLFPASITKIMTGLLAIENSKGDYNQKITMSETSLNSLPPQSSSIGLVPGEILTYDQSLYGLMLASANELSNAFGEHISGSQENFVQLMNSRAKELGAVNTNFMNAHGLHNENHYTTPYDMALIFREAVQNESFLKYISTFEYTIPPTNLNEKENSFKNTNRLINPISEFFNENAIGGKTGYTTPAMHTLVSYAKKGDLELIAVTMKGEKFKTFEDSNILFNYGFDKFSEQEVFNSIDFKIEEIPIVNEKNKEVMTFDAIVNNEILKMSLPNIFDKNKVVLKNNLKEVYTETEIKENKIIGEVSIEYEGKILDKKNIIVSNIKKADILNIIFNNEDKEETSKTSSSFLLKFLIFCLIIISIIIILLILREIIRERERRKRKRLKAKRDANLK